MSVSVVAGKPSVSTGDPGIQWAPISGPVRLQFSGTSCEDTLKALQTAFGSFPVRLSTGEHLFILRGMAAAAGGGSQPYQQLITALTQFGQLELTTV
jgi:hypothetical protein